MEQTHQVLIVQSKWYFEITEHMVCSAKRVFTDKNIKTSVYQVPGSFEIPAAISMFANASLNQNQFDGYVAIGCVIRGETSHYDYVCEQTSRGIMELSFKEQIPIGFGVLTVENLEQAWHRAKEKDKGKEAAQTCCSMIELKQRLNNIS